MGSISLPVNVSVKLVHDPEKTDGSKEEHKNGILVSHILIKLITQPAGYKDGKQELQAEAAVSKIITRPTGLPGWRGSGLVRHFHLF